MLLARPQYHPSGDLRALFRCKGFGPRRAALGPRFVGASLFCGKLAFDNLAARDIDHEFGELGRVARAFGIGQIFDLSKRNMALSPSIWAVSRDAS